MANGQVAGLVRSGEQYHQIGVEKRDGLLSLFVDHNGKRIAGPSVEGATIHLGTTNDADDAQFIYSLDGKSFNGLGEAFKLTFGRWRGDRLGVFTWNDTADAGIVDVDSFIYNYNRQ